VVVLYCTHVILDANVNYETTLRERREIKLVNDTGSM